MSVRVRIAPSPTGYLHIGTARSALFNFLFARHEKGSFILRVEDTDVERSKKEFEDDIVEGLRWLGLDWDEGPDGAGEYGPYRQSERLPLYREALEKLLSEKKAYYCYCTTEEVDVERKAAELSKRPYRYSRRCFTNPSTDRTESVIRFHFSEDHGAIEWEDGVRGKVLIDRSELDDMIIARSVDEPLYNFAVVIDDAAMQITHVIRGEDHISNTPKQIELARALGLESPIFAHMPLILNPDRTKMSKRSNETSLLWYRTQGYLPEAMVNFLVLLGWNPGTEQELFTPAELIQQFSLDRVQKSGAVFNQEKLLWFNRSYLLNLSVDDLVRRAQPFVPANFPSDLSLTDALVMLRSRVSVLSELTPLLEQLTQEHCTMDADLLVWPKLLKRVGDPVEAQRLAHEQLTRLVEFLPTIPEWSIALLESTIKEWIQKNNYGVGDTLWPLRVALSGQQDSPTPFELLATLGKERSLKRLAYANSLLAKTR